jgi:hypothetical protein
MAVGAAAALCNASFRLEIHVVAVCISVKCIVICCSRCMDFTIDVIQASTDRNVMEA